MQVILKERISNLGDLGDEVSVRNGYARNYLLPSGRALRATPENREVFERQREELEKLAIEKLDGAQRRGALLEDRTVTILVRVAEGGRLYGSVGPVEISRALTAEGVEVHKSEVKMPDGIIRETGEFEVDIQVHADVSKRINVFVEEE